MHKPSLLAAQLHAKSINALEFTRFTVVDECGMQICAFFNVCRILLVYNLYLTRLFIFNDNI